jgi:hypothetical protein
MTAHLWRAAAPTGERARLATAREAAAFILAGNATFTVQSSATQTRFTYRVRQPDPTGPHFVALLNGQDNENDYVFLGTIFGAPHAPKYRHGAK